MRCKTFVTDHKTSIILISILLMVLVLTIVLGVTLSYRAKSETAESYNRSVINDFRLPRSIIPYHYTLEVKPYLIPENFVFDGKVQIMFTCVEETDKVIFHSSGLTLVEDNIIVRCITDNSHQKIQGVNFNSSNDFVVINLHGNLKVNNEYLIIIEYNGTANTKEKGLFISNFLDDQEIMHYTASTQLEPIHAREVFPCFDEPALKSTFDIIVVRWRNMTSISNMPRIKVEDRGLGWEADIYARSMKMSTYTVAIIVGNYTGKTEGKVTVWAPKGLNGSSDFALGVSLKFLDFYEELLGVPYFPPKLDMAATTTDTFEAMENWGLIIYQKDLLLLNKDTDAITIASVVAHEIAHQWFGNLVTAEWWSDIWLNEGMSTYMQQIALKHFYPEEHKIDQSLVYASTQGFSLDCYPTDPPMSDEGNMDSDAHIELVNTVWKNVTDKASALDDSVFDEMSYEKGAVIIRMIHNILGDEMFWKFISMYLKKNAYNNVNETGFWTYVSLAQPEMKQTMNSMIKMKTWTHLPGLPIVSVVRNYEENKALLFQQSCKNISRYRRDRWHIPISYRNEGDKELDLSIKEWLSGDETILLDTRAKNEWIFINQGADAFIVAYDSYNWHLLAVQLRKNHKVFTLDQRYKILADANNLFTLKFPNVTVGTLLDLFSYLHFEEEYVMLQQPNDNFLMNALSLMKLSPMSKEWKEYIIYILGPLYDKFSVRKDVPLSVSRLKQLFFWLCEFDYTSCVREALRKFEIWKNRVEMDESMMDSVENDGVTADEDVLCTAVRKNSANEKFIYELYMKEESTLYLSALFCSSNSTLIARLLQKYERTRDISFFRSANRLADNERHWKMLFDYVEKHFETFANNRRSFTAMVGLFRLLKDSPRQTVMVVEIARRHLPNLSRWARTQMEREIQEMEKEFPNHEIIMDSIENWLRGKSWTM